MSAIEVGEIAGIALVREIMQAIGHDGALIVLIAIIFVLSSAVLSIESHNKHIIRRDVVCN
jgi:hypothetical protein